MLGVPPYRAEHVAQGYNTSEKKMLAQHAERKMISGYMALTVAAIAAIAGGAKSCRPVDYHQPVQASHTGSSDITP